MKEDSTFFINNSRKSRSYFRFKMNVNEFKFYSIFSTPKRMSNSEEFYLLGISTHYISEELLHFPGKLLGY